VIQPTSTHSFLSLDSYQSTYFNSKYIKAGFNEAYPPKKVKIYFKADYRARAKERRVERTSKKRTQYNPTFYCFYFYRIDSSCAYFLYDFLPSY
jgi:hypothetical protein